jgi:phosphoribosylamine--glycine ligase
MRSKGVVKVVVSPGNAGIAIQYQCQNLATHDEIINYCTSEAIGLVFIGPEQPIAHGLSDKLVAAGIPVIAPSQYAAQLESSKIFAKELMLNQGIPTARYIIAKNLKEAEALLSEFSYPLVIKADGLAAGKGVSIAHNLVDAMEALHSTEFTAQGVILEEFLQGWEASLFAITDGQHFVSTIFAQDHKQLYDYDTGPNTGGMGAYAPVPEAETYRAQIEDEIISPILAAMREMGHPYKGILYCGLMITSEGPKVIEFNCRLGDPEAEVLLPLLETYLMDICQAILSNDVINLHVEFKNSTAVAVVLASEGYPQEYAKGYPISIPEPLPTGVYFCGVRRAEKGFVTSGGRVLCVTGMGDNITDARTSAYAKLSKVSFHGQTYRKDIGLRKNSL